jgi:uncharacterized protein
VVSKPRRGRAPDRPGGAAPAAAKPLAEHEIAELQALLDDLAAPLEPLDVCALDGFLCGVIVQPQAIAPARWLRFVTDVEGRPLPAGFDARSLHALVRRREAELRRAIERREWFDPWIFELELESESESDASAAARESVLSWVGGCTAALETFPALLGSGDEALTAPLALLYRYVGTDTLDDADALRDEIEMLEPPADLGAAVEELVRATLLLADVAGVRATR